MTSTQQNEALQAVRLLRGHALASGSIKTTATIEAIYQVCKLLEGFIESAGVLESDGIAAIDEITYEGATFKVGEHVFAHDPNGKIVSVKLVRFITEHGLAGVEDDTMRFSLRFFDMLVLNPEGSK
jgi:hypothetical protein